LQTQTEFLRSRADEPHDFSVTYRYNSVIPFARVSMTFGGLGILMPRNKDIFGNNRINV